MDEVQLANAKKWPRGISSDPSENTDGEITDFMTTKLNLYKLSGLTDGDLQFLFKEDFEKWTADDFNKAYGPVKAELRVHLIRGGCYIRPHDARKGNRIADTLYELQLRDTEHEWTDNEIRLTLGKVGSFFSIGLRDRLNPNKDGLRGEGYTTLTPVTIAPVTSGGTASSGNTPSGGDTTFGAYTTAATSNTGGSGNGGGYTGGGGNLGGSASNNNGGFASNNGAGQNQGQNYQGYQGQNQQGQNYQGHNQGTNTNTTGYSREIATVAKIYTSDQKYSGTGDSFDYKLRIFREICTKAGLPPEGYMLAFSTMLTGFAERHYYSCELFNQSFDNACNNIRTFYEGEEFYNKNLVEWNAIHLDDFVRDPGNEKSSVYNCFQMMIDKLDRHRQGLRPSLRTDELLYNKIKLACQGVPACMIANSAAGINNLTDLIMRTKASIVEWEKQNPSATINTYYTAHHTEEQEPDPESFYTDRRYRGRAPARFIGGQRRGSNRGRGGYSRGGYDRGGGYRHSGTKKCYVCQKPGCWSWKHSDEEREKARKDFKAKFNDRTGGRYSEKTIEGKYEQYITDCEGEEEQIDEAFENLILDVEADFEVSSDLQDTPTSYLTSLGELSCSEAAATANSLLNRSFAHVLCPSATSLLKSLPTKDLLTKGETEDLPGLPIIPITYTTAAKSRYGKETFIGIIVDTGAAEISTAGYNQYCAFQEANPGLATDLDTSTTVTVKFGVGHATSIGSTQVITSLGVVIFHIMKAETPFLLCLADMDKLGVYFNNLQNLVVTRTKETVPVVRKFGHAFLLCNSALQTYITESFEQYPSHLSEVELRRLHRRFGHPAVDRLYKLLDRAGHEIDKKVLEHLTKFCHFCQKHGKSPGRFRFTLREDVEFNFNIIVDVMYINNRPILHVVDESTRFNAARWLKDISANHTWEVLKMCWIDSYLGPPDLITTDAGKNFLSKEFRQYAADSGIRVRTMPVEAHNSIGMVERYHGPLRRAYSIIRTELKDASEAAVLQMAIKAINDTAGPDGLVPTLLVFGAYPRMVESDPPAPTVVQRANAIKKAMVEVRKLRAERQIADALAQRNGPRVTDVHDLPLNSEVLVWREGNANQAGRWQGPYTLLSIDGESCEVQLKSSRTLFRSTAVKPYYRDPAEEIDPEAEMEDDLEGHSDTGGDIDLGVPRGYDNDIPLPVPAAPVKRGRGRPRKYPLLQGVADIEVHLQYHEKGYDTQFDASRLKELTGLLEKGVFEIVTFAEVPQGVRLFNSRFVDEVKFQGTDKAFEKSRLVVQAYNDGEKDLVLTQSPTIQRVSQRLILCIAAIKVPSDQERSLYLRDISQAYVQSTTNLNRQFFVRPPKEMHTIFGLGEDAILHVLKPLYGVPEAGNHWFRTYHEHHTVDLEMGTSTYDPCLLYSTEPFGVIGMQTDDTIILADAEMAEREEVKLREKELLAKEREQLTPSHPLNFNGGIIKQGANGNITLTQERQCGNLSTVGTRAAANTSTRGVTKVLSPKDQYIAQRARGAYIASMCQPEAAFDLSYAAQVVNPVEENTKALNKRLEWQIENSKRGLTFVKLDSTSLQLIAFTDASFANNKDLSSQIGYVLVLTDATNKANIVHWSSAKCKRVTRSVLASELYGMAHGFDVAVAVKGTVDKILQISLPLILATDSKSLYDCLVRLGTTQEKRLMVDVMCLRQDYERRLISEIKWIDGDSNPADAMTKSKACPALTQLIDTNEIDLQAIGWVERSAKAKGAISTKGKAEGLGGITSTKGKAEGSIGVVA